MSSSDYSGDSAGWLVSSVTRCRRVSRICQVCGPQVGRTFFLIMLGLGLRSCQLQEQGEVRDKAYLTH